MRIDEDKVTDGDIGTDQEKGKDMIGSSRPREDRLEKRKKKKGKGPYILGMLGCILVMLLVMYLGTGLYVWIEEGLKNNKEDAAVAAGIVDTTYTKEELDAQVNAAVAAARQEEQAQRDAAVAQEREHILGGIKQSLAGGTSTVETLRPYYPGELVLASNGAYHFLPIRDDLKKHNLVQENVNVLESGEIQYLENGQVVSHKGIDVSQHQGTIDWQKVAADGVEFAFIRVAFRGYSTGKLVEDEQFDNNIKGALENGIRVGVYVFSQAVTEEEVQEEAALVLQKIAPYKVQFPVVFDVEKVADKGGRMNLITVEERTNLAISFCNTIKGAGYTPMIYQNMEMGALLIDLGLLEEYEKWFAYYGTDLYYPYEYQVWQYSDKGTVNGINGPVDLNISFKLWGE